jgi:ribose transport system ATP-binding protein
MINQYPILQMQDVHKRYPGVHALKGINLEIYNEEVHALVGENGAGKSTLMKILAGAESMDQGSIFIDGQPVEIRNPHQAQALGISIIYQEFNLVPQFSAIENIYLGREPGAYGFINGGKGKAESQQLLQSLGFDFDITIPVSRLSIANQQMVEIAKALSVDSKIIVMDEPSATLTSYELNKLFETIRNLKKRGISVIYISHRLEEIFEICNRLTIMRDGEWISTKSIDEIDRDGIIELMVGRSITEEYPKEHFKPGSETLCVKGLSNKQVKDVSFSVHEGEIVALTGLVGAGRTETARMLFGVDQPEQGEISFLGQTVVLSSPRQAIDLGICLLTEDRKEQGLVLGMKIRENITLPTLQDVCRLLFINSDEEKSVAEEKLKELNIKAPSIEVLAKNLSGGNQQKVVLAKWLVANSKLYIFDEPTRGIDVGAKREIYLLMNELLRKGAAIIMISSELPEVLGMADRILVMNAGCILGELSHAEATQEKIMDLAITTVVNQV